MSFEKKYLKVNTSKLFDLSKKKAIAHLLWGDMVQYEPNDFVSDGLMKVKARGKIGYINSNDLGDESLLELYFIDVGQGDGVLIKTPTGEHIMIDGGYKRKFQQSGKNAADFVDWKFSEEYGMDTIVLDAMIASHNDADHYGGLWDLINPNEQHELSILTQNVEVKKFYHAGVAWLEDNLGKRTLGPVIDKKLTLLVDTLNDIDQLLTTGINGYKLQGDWAAFMKCISDKQIVSERICNKTKLLPEFTNDEKEFKINVLAPIEVVHQNKPAYDNLGKKTDYSQNTNGHSITLRVDYKKVKVMLTGDLNMASQKSILEFYRGEDNTKILSCDVSKACHHGSDDCSFEFLSHLGAGATIISSGDAEGHDHPRPSIVAASALTGHKLVKDDKIQTPLIYSTEISRSYKIGQPFKLKLKDATALQYTPANVMDVTYKETNAGDLNPATKTKTFWDKKIVGGIIYGLVNVRTDGNKILCATMSEKSNEWDIKEFETRF